MSTPTQVKRGQMPYNLPWKCETDRNASVDLQRLSDGWRCISTDVEWNAAGAPWMGQRPLNMDTLRDPNGNLVEWIDPEPEAPAEMWVNVQKSGAHRARVTRRAAVRIADFNTYGTYRYVPVERLEAVEAERDRLKAVVEFAAYNIGEAPGGTSLYEQVQMRAYDALQGGEA